MSTPSSSSSTAAAVGIRTWRTAFLTLRDETLISPPPDALLGLLRRLLASHSLEPLVAAAPHLPAHEVTSDLVFTAELASAALDCSGAADIFISACRLLYDVSQRVRLELNSTCRASLLSFLEKLVACLVGEAEARKRFLSSREGMQTIFEMIEITRYMVKLHGRECSDSENTQLIELLLHIVSCIPIELADFSSLDASYLKAFDSGSRRPRCHSLLEVHHISFTIIGDTLSKMGALIPQYLWQSMIEVLRKMLDMFASKNLLFESPTMSRYCTAVLHCLHMLLSEPKGSLSEHAAGLVAALQMFFMYGWVPGSNVFPATSSIKNKMSSPDMKSSSLGSKGGSDGAYIPPHLRGREGNTQSRDFRRLSIGDPSTCCFSSSDSEQSDSDGYAKDEDRFRSSKARVTALACIQDLCHADPKSVTSMLTILLPTNDVLQQRKNSATILTVLLFDPILKVRIAAASTLSSILEGNSSTFLQVSEYKDFLKCGSFTTLSSSLGQILLQIHRGVLHLVQHEVHSGLLSLLFKILLLLISVTPYSRMPADLLPTLIGSTKASLSEVLPSRNDHINIMASALSCIGSALSRSPPSSHVLLMLKEETPIDIPTSSRKSTLLNSLFRYSQQSSHPIIRLEALQALKAAVHNYPSVANAFWGHISATILGSLQEFNSDSSYSEIVANTEKGDGRYTGSSIEKCAVASVKVLDECLRASSGFRGVDDSVECKLLDVRILSDCSREKRVSSAPVYELGTETNGNALEYSGGLEHWCQVIENVLPLTRNHSSPQIRAASITCFAGLTSPIFFSLTEDKQNLIVRFVVSAALHDKVTSVKSAACRAIGLLACFKHLISRRRILDEFVQAAELNTHDPSISVRITSSWALANICDSLRYLTTDCRMKMEDKIIDLKVISTLIETSLRLTKDGDKIKSNAVRALGNLSRFVRFTVVSTGKCCQADTWGDLHWLERMVQAFLSCVTTGNVKVQWNVCHALGNLFLNDTLKLWEMPWASSVYTILLLLLRDSTNFKIRIHAAIALSIPSLRIDYGSSFSDVLQGAVLVLESLGSDLSSLPSNIKYKDALEKQLCFTTLHLFGCISTEDNQILKDFIIKKTPFLEEWFTSICSSFNVCHELEAVTEVKLADGSCSYEVRKTMVSKAAESLTKLYRHSNNPNLCLKFTKLLDSLT